MTTPFLILFDCDGVLVDSERLMQAVDMRMIGDLGWRITQDEMFNQFLGRSEAVGTVNIEHRLGRPVPESFVEDDELRMRPLSPRAWHRFPGSMEP